MRKTAMMLAVLGVLAGTGGVAQGTTSLWNQVEALRNDVGYSDATPFRRASVRMLASRITASAPTGQVPTDVAARAREQMLDFLTGPSMVMLESRRDRADGFYAFRLGSEQPPLILQTPHSWHDLNSGRIAAALFEEGTGRVLCMNTAQRYRGQDDPPTDLNSDADVAHRPDSLFQAMTLGIAEGMRDPLVVQIHGFGSAHQGMAAVVSDGAALQPARDVTLAAAALRPVLGTFGAIYTGSEVTELAGRGNVQGQALSGTTRFLHIELSYTARKALLTDRDLRGRFGAVLEALAARDTRALDAAGGATP